MTIVYDDADEPESTSALGGGTTPFMVPELLSLSMFGKAKCQVSKEADVYASGMVILQVRLSPRGIWRYTEVQSRVQVSSGLVPFHSLRNTEIWCKVIQGERPAMPTNAGGSGISDGLWQLLV